MYGASIVGYKVNQKEERRRIVLETIPFTDIHVVIFEMKGSASPPTLRRRK